MFGSKEEVEENAIERLTSRMDDFRRKNRKKFLEVFRNRLISILIKKKKFEDDNDDDNSDED